MRVSALLTLALACAVRADDETPALPAAAAKEETFALPDPSKQVCSSGPRPPPPRDDDHCKDILLDDIFEYDEDKLCRSFEQATAPKDINKANRKIFAKINEKIHDVVGIDIKYSADDLRGHKIGWRKVNGTLEKKVGGSVKSECINVLYFVRDTDECTSTYPGYAHNCHSSAHCVNVPQGFECECPIPGKDGHLPTEQQQFGVKGSGSIKSPARYGRKHTDGKCWGHVSTHACCHDHNQCDEDGCISNCHANFECTVDPCHASDCAKHAVCIAHPKGYADAHEHARKHDKPHGRATHGDWGCQCEKDYIGDGEKECVPVPKPDFCEDARCPCNCECVSFYDKDKPDTNGYMCKPRAGFTNYTLDELPSDHVSKGGNRLDNHECVDATPPKIELDGGNPIRLKQGSRYEDLGIIVTDNNNESFSRTVKVAYSEPIPHCLDVVIGPDMPEAVFNITYKLMTPWLAVAEYDTSRQVIVSDIDECGLSEAEAERLEKECPKFVSRCDIHNGAKCTNTIGSYDCSCPPGYEGDGMVAPYGHGCLDKTPPTIECVMAETSAMKGLRKYAVDDFTPKCAEGDKACRAACPPLGYHAASMTALVPLGQAGGYVDQNPDFHFVDSELKKKYAVDNKLGAAAFCEKPPCWKAGDRHYDGFVEDLTGAITVVDFKKIPDSCDLDPDFHLKKYGDENITGVPQDLHCSWRLTFSVKDKADPANGPVYATREIIVVFKNLTDHLDSDEDYYFSSLGGPRVFVNLPGAIYGVLKGLLSILFALIIILLLPVILKALYWTARAVQVAVAPGSMLSTRPLFEDSYWVLLAIQSFGRMETRERLQRTALAWSELVNKANL